MATLENKIRQQSEQQKKAGVELDATCHICLKTKFADGVGHICHYCKIRCCARCGGKVTLRSNKVSLAICAPFVLAYREPLVPRVLLPNVQRIYFYCIPLPTNVLSSVSSPLWVTSDKHLLLIPSVYNRCRGGGIVFNQFL